MTTKNSLMLASACALALAACGADDSAKDMSASEKAPVTADASDAFTIHPEIWPRGINPVQRDPAVEAEVARLLATMSNEQKVGQLIQADIGSVTPADVAKYHLGSVLNGGNSAPNGNLRADPQEWVDLADEFWLASTGPDGTGIPLIWGTDAVHGHSNVIGATIFPHNIGLGAANDPALIRKIGAVTAREVAVSGLDWTFAPTVATPRDDRWGRAYEGYSEDGRIVGAYAGEMVKGIQGEPGTDEFMSGDKVISTVKHFVGDGGTKDGIDQGETIATEEQLRDIHAAGYLPAIESGVQSAMASFSSWGGRKMHGHKELLSDVLVDQMGFDGFVVGDWNGHGQVKGCTATDCPESLIAGVDMFMAPDSWKGLYENTLAQVESGEVSMERLDEAVSRVLRVKVRAGVMEAGLPSTRPVAGKFELLGSPEHRAVAREAVRKSLVLLKNEGVLPLSPSANVLVTGASADDMGRQTGGWTISWQGDGNSREDFPGAQTIFEGIAETVSAAGGTATLSADGSYSNKPDVAIVVFGEVPYAEFVGDLDNVDFADETALNTMRELQAADIPVVAVFVTGRPLYMNPELNASDAFLSAWLPGTEGGGIADVLFTDGNGEIRHDFVGRLSFSWPARPDQARLNVGDADYDPLFAYGFGLSYGDDGSLAMLPTDYEISIARSDVVFEDGSTEPWTLMLSSAGAETVSFDARPISTADDAISLARIDRNAQEDSLQVTWTGGAAASLEAGASTIDWSRQANGELALEIQYRLDAPLSGPVVWGMGCGDDCAATYPLAASGAVGEWQTEAIRLSCFGDAGVNLAEIDRPFILSASTPITMSVSYVGLATSPGGTVCPQ